MSKTKIDLKDLRFSQADTEALRLFEQSAKRKSTGKIYRERVSAFCRMFGITPLELVNATALNAAKAKMDADINDRDAALNYDFLRTQTKRRLEDLVERCINENKAKIAPKSLNLMISAVKKFALFNHVIDNFAQFRQFDFDKTSRAANDTDMLDAQRMKTIFDAADIREKCVIGLYGIHGCRPSIIHQLILEDIKNSHDTVTPLFKNGIPVKIELAPKTWIMVKAQYDGNKARVDFPIILTEETANWISTHLNARAASGEKLTLQSQIVRIRAAPSNPSKSVDDIAKKLFKVAGFNERAYNLRHYAHGLLKEAISDPELKEWVFGHKGGISAVYDHLGHRLTQSEIQQYNSKIDTSKMRIYGVTNDELERAKLSGEVLRRLGTLDNEKFQELMRALEIGTMSFEQFDKELTLMARAAQDKQITERFEKLLKEHKDRNGGTV